ncbi:NAD-dependent epimerase/dehydratase family protein [Microbispora sp. SCL1-1]|uniref:NAD-dependent epimerase/dehydratase family protein n=1 Tax=unclassified Microbispora TaxID=2614687 RepID=UPI00115A0D44|nr:MULTISPECIES: NAD-dependent epimerase/dehydratase family protein [unclassified Microbispora]NJP25571.1 NAD-dependent epimerase/dehydratase family protein [Microbispora sp. CL1-1]TQS13523.1 NAD-dependent epimerase/dehydratase family protein [Microbispora sp. SCL1-1]
MRVLITGASGYVGGVVAEHLVRAGHEVVALARSDRARERVEALGAKAVSGSLRDLDVLRGAAASAEAVVHTAVDYTDPEMGDIERAALAALLDGLNEGGRFVYTSTGLVYPDRQGATVDEDHPVAPETSPQPYKVLGERQVLDAGHVAGTVIRAALVYGRGGSGLLQGLIGAGRQNGMVPYIGDGANEWSSVHVDDLAALYVAVLEHGGPGAVVNAASAERTPMRRIAEAAAALTGAQAVSLTLEQGTAAMGPLAATLTRSSPLDASRARRLYGWSPAGPGLIEELTTGSYAGS